MLSRPELSDAALILVALRHQKAVEEGQNHCSPSNDLTSEGQRDVSDLVQVVNHVDVHNLDLVLTGTLPRHEQTTRALIAQTGYPGCIESTPYLNAIDGGDLFEEPDREKIARKYELDRFSGRVTQDGIVTDPEFGLFGFDPRFEGIYPPTLFSTVTVDRRLRDLMFRGRSSPLTNFEEVARRVTRFQSLISERAKSMGSAQKPYIGLAVGSCSILAFNYEYSRYGTIGENVITHLEGPGPYTEAQLRDYRKGKRLYPHQHEEVSVFYMTKKDLSEGSRRLRLLDARIPIRDFLEEKYGHSH